jgi:mRNA-degrading endonuclease RelE of RelBE toxin-antitoxin system
VAKVYFTPNTEKILSKLKDKKLEKRFRDVKSILERNPLAGKKLIGKLEGQYSLRIWPYRIVYFINQEKDVIITDIRHRKDVYR